jgi:polysaccharide chain length determinant protein (PEP-CTERM system associated)
MQEQIAFVIGEIRSALRFRWFGMATAWGLCVAGWIYVASLPDIYEAEARFFLDTSSLLTPVLENQIIATDPQAQLTYIRESLLGRAELESVAREVGLDAGIDNDLAYEAMLNALRSSIQFDDINPSANQRAGDRIYNLRYRHESRDKAIAVVQALFNTFIEGALGETRRNEDEALKFVDESIKAREDELRRQERAISDFKRANSDRLPGAQGEYLTRLQTENEGIAEARRRLRSLESRRTQHVRQIEQLRAVVPGFTSDRPTSSLAASIATVQRELDELRLRYTDVHPDVVARGQALEDLKRQRSAELAALGLEGSDLELLELESNPVYQEAQIALNETELAIAELETEIAEREANVLSLESIIDESLDNETRLAELERDYDVKNEEYLELVRSRQSLILTLQASAAEQMDFRSIQEPRASLAPVEPNRLFLVLAVFGGALAAGAGVCYGLAQFRPVFSNAQAVRDFAGLPVLGVVTNAWPAAAEAEFRRSVWRYGTALALLGVMFVGVVGFEVLGPGLHAPFAG